MIETEPSQTTGTERTFTPTDNITNGVYDPTSNAVLIDCNLGLIAVGENVTASLGSIRSYRDLDEFIEPAQAFRLEQFVVRKAPFARLTALEIAIRGCARFKFAVAMRHSVFGKDTVILEFYPDRRAKLMADKLALKYMSRPAISGMIDDTVSEAESIMSVFAETHPAEAEALRTVVTSVIRRSLAPVLIESIISPTKNRNAAIDVADLARSAAKYIKNAFPGSAVATEFMSERKRRTPIVTGVSPDHMWDLVTCALTTLIGISADHSAAISIAQSEARLGISFCANVGAVADGFPPQLTLGEVREMLPPSTMRLYLCELICEEYAAASDVSFADGNMTLSFEFDLPGEGQQFHRFETAHTDERMRNLLTDVVIIPDEPKEAS